MKKEGGKEKKTKKKERGVKKKKKKKAEPSFYVPETRFEGSRRRNLEPREEEEEAR